MTPTHRTRFHPALLLMTFALLIAGPASVHAYGSGAGADHDTLSGSEIEALIAGNTVGGAMAESGEYTEYYAEDGTIHGDGYTGEWTVEDDAMCFDYGEGATCYEIAADGNQVEWIKDGEVDGTGMVADGNPMEF